ncbi:unnamed protein product [Orchesella dallaii]|uniref:Ras-associating domain-containing protein n=1 Tax=Orchesella dallaii TaxID=48710 RepID=A0ABP1QTH0_9HEXA
MRAASVTRLYVKAFTQDGSSKALMVEESMTCGRVLALLADKNHVQLSQKWTLVEHLPHLHMERIYEDHENMVENLLMWTRDSKNKILFVEKNQKYDMFVNPQKYFLETRVSHSGGCMDEHTKNGLIEEFFAHGVGVPEVESFLYLKAEGKKAWKKFPFVLRASGIYYCPKGRTHASKDLICLATIDHNIQGYQGVGWKKKFKSPSEFGFALKPARLQVKSHRHMKYLCAEDGDTLRLWMAGIRIAKYGKQLWDNYRSLMEDMAHEDLDRFGRSVSLASMPQQTNNPLVISTADSNSNNESTNRRVSQESYQSPCQSHSVVNSIEKSLAQKPLAPLPKEEGFESDCPMGGTIKRKPSTALIPKIPLTMNTRSIVGDFINVSSAPGDVGTVTLQRKRSLSGNSSGSSCSSMVSQIHVATKETVSYQRTQPQIGQSVQVKPSTGMTLMRSQHNGPEPLAEETMDSLDLENLPPPPPELLTSAPEPSNSANPLQVPFPPPPPPLNDTNVLTPSANIVSSTITGNSCIKSNTNSDNYTVKRVVSFSNELSERLKSRSHDSTSATSHIPTGKEDVGENLYGMVGGNKTSGQKRVGFNIYDSNLIQSSSSPKKLEDPPEHFLHDLQRVMQKKWQVAQKCNADRNTTPQEILGFRIEPVNDQESVLLPPPLPMPMEELNVNQVQDTVPVNPSCPVICQPAVPTPVTNANLNNVEAWVSQHYGTVMGNLGKMPQANNRPSPPPVGQKPAPPQRAASYLSTSSSSSSTAIYQQINHIPLSHNSSSNSVVIYENFEGRKSSISKRYPGVELRHKRPPPPVPKRAESTHLSAHIVFN